VHEAAHALGTARKQKDVTGYQYHNRTFKVNAEELGLTVTKVKNRGFAHTDLTEELKDAYRETIERLDKATVAIRAPRTVKTKTAQGQVKMLCACGIVIRCGKRVAATARILCEDCGHHFHPENELELQASSLWRED
jgi:hypothetical protein